VAEEFAQEAALRAWSRRRQLRDGAPVGPWLNRILVNLVIDRSRAHHDELIVTDIEERWHDDDYTVDPEQVLARAELRDEIEDALVRLPAGYRTVVVRKVAEGLPHFDWGGERVGGRMNFRYLPAAERVVAAVRHRVFSARLGLRAVGLARRGSGLRWRKSG